VSARFEYRFVALRDLTRRKLAGRPYRDIVEEHAEEGWRLVQVFAPGSRRRSPELIELIFERPVGVSESGERERDLPAVPI
jgi:hypothetical protein